MARCTRLIISCLLIAFSLDAFCALDAEKDPTLEIIKSQDKEEAVPQINRESLQCKVPKAKTNTVTILSGDAYHMGNKIHVQCLDGLQFDNGQTSVNATCQPAPHPCMCIALWNVNFNLMNDLNCTDTSEHEEPLEGRYEVVGHGSPNEEVIPGNPEAHDDPQCPDPTPVNGTMKIIRGQPYLDGCIVTLTCNPGLVFPNGRSVWNLSCVALPVLPNAVAWVPTYEGKPTCRDKAQTLRETQRRDVQETFPIAGESIEVPETVVETYESPANEEQTEVLIEEHEETGEEFPERENEVEADQREEVISTNGEEEEDHHENELQLPEHEDESNSNEDESLHQHEPEEYEEMEPLQQPPIEDTISDNEEQTDDPQCPDPTPVNGTMKIVRGQPYSYGCNVILTCNPGLVFDDGLSVWNLTCLAVPYPNTVIWVPADKGKPICREPQYETEYEQPEQEEPGEKSEEVHEDETETQGANEETEEQYEEAEGDQEIEQEVMGYEEEYAESEIEHPHEYEEIQEHDSHVEEEQEENEEQETEIREGGNVEEEEEIQSEDLNEETEIENLSEEEVVQEREEETEEQEISQPNEEHYLDTEEFNNEPHRSELDWNNIQPENEINRNNHADEYEELTNEISEFNENTHLTAAEIYQYQTGQKLQGQMKGENIVLDAILDKHDDEEEEELEENRTEKEQEVPEWAAEDVDVPGWFEDVQQEPVGESSYIVPPPEAADACSIPPKTGPCRMYLQRYFFNSRTKECELFVYGGCNGNGNNFESLRDCMNKCFKDTSS